MNVAAALSEADAARAIRLSTRRSFGVVAGAFSIMFVTFGTACSALGRFTLASLADRIGTDATLRFQSIAEVASPIRPLPHFILRVAGGSQTFAPLISPCCDPSHAHSHNDWKIAMPRLFDDTRSLSPKGSHL